MRETRKRMKERFRDEYEELRQLVELELYREVLEDFVKKHDVTED